MGEKFGIFGLSANARFVLTGIVSLLLMVCDSHFNMFKDVRYYVESVMTPLFYIADAPNTLVYNVEERMVSYNDLLNENRFLRQQIAEIRTDLLRYDSLAQENEQLKKLNNSYGNVYMRIGAEVLRVDTNPFSMTVLINRGRKDGVYEGQPVINEQGVVGQVISVAHATSRVLLLSDQNHALPVVVMRNGVRAIVSGTGLSNELVIKNLPRNVDIKVGDLLVTSGLGGRFPGGYPVAKVVKSEGREWLQFAEIKAVPLASLDRLRHMLLIWNHEPDFELFEDGKQEEDVIENMIKKVLPPLLPEGKQGGGSLGSYSSKRSPHNRQTQAGTLENNESAKPKVESSTAKAKNIKSKSEVKQPSAKAEHNDPKKLQESSHAH